jgi:predicted ArsR family transcriptional regulator
MSGFSEGIAAAAALKDELRSRIYGFIRRSRRAVTREEVAADAGISTKLAAFHLDHLVDRGLLNTHFARPEGRSGPGAGRTSKFYQPSDKQVEISIPPRKYDVAGELLLRALSSQTPEESPGEAALRVSNEAGLELGRELRASAGKGRVGAERALRVIENVLEERGYEPYRAEKGVVRLKNCPFHHLAQQAPEFICAMNRQFVDGIAKGLGNDSLQVLLEPSPTECCVCMRLPSGDRSDPR